jgi:hypothetical protein
MIYGQNKLSIWILMTISNRYDEDEQTLNDGNNESGKKYGPKPLR